MCAHVSICLNPNILSPPRIAVKALDLDVQRLLLLLRAPGSGRHPSAPSSSSTSPCFLPPGFDLHRQRCPSSRCTRAAAAMVIMMTHAAHLRKMQLSSSCSATYHRSSRSPAANRAATSTTARGIPTPLARGGTLVAAVSSLEIVRGTRMLFRVVSKVEGSRSCRHSMCTSTRERQGRYHENYENTSSTRCPGARLQGYDHHQSIFLGKGYCESQGAGQNIEHRNRHCALRTLVASCPGKVVQ